MGVFYVYSLSCYDRHQLEVNVYPILNYLVTWTRCIFKASNPKPIRSQDIPSGSQFTSSNLDNWKTVYNWSLLMHRQLTLWNAILAYKCCVELILLNDFISTVWRGKRLRAQFPLEEGIICLHSIFLVNSTSLALSSIERCQRLTSRRMEKTVWVNQSGSCCLTTISIWGKKSQKADDTLATSIWEKALTETLNIVQLLSSKILDGVRVPYNVDFMWR